MNSDTLFGDSAARPWQLQAAKARFSEVFRLVRSRGPQWVTRQGKEAVVVISAEEFERLKAHGQERQPLSAFFAQSPLVGSGIEIERDRDTGRDVPL